MLVIDDIDLRLIVLSGDPRPLQRTNTDTTQTTKRIFNDDSILKNTTSPLSPPNQKTTPPRWVSAKPPTKKSSRPPLRIITHQIIQIHAQTPRIVLHIQALCFSHRNCSNATHVAVSPVKVRSPDIQPFARETLHETAIDSGFAVVRFVGRAGRAVAAGGIGRAHYDTHVGVGCRFWVGWLGYG
jgi:hypothetical protein